MHRRQASSSQKMSIEGCKMKCVPTQGLEDGGFREVLGSLHERGKRQENELPAYTRQVTGQIEQLEETNAFLSRAINTGSVSHEPNVSVPHATLVYPSGGERPNREDAKGFYLEK